MKYSVKKNTYVQRASKSKLVDSDPTIMFSKGDTVNGNEFYIVLGKDKSFHRVVKVATNKYLPFEDLESTEPKSGLILPPTFFAGGMQQEGYSYYVNNNKPIHTSEISNAVGSKTNPTGIVSGFIGKSINEINSGFTGIVPPNNLAIDWADKNTIYSSVEGDETVIELTPEQVKEQHKASGSKKSFDKWVNGEGKGWITAFGSQLADLIDGKKPNTGTGKPSGKPTGGKKNDDKPTKILGMHPVTFTLATVGVLGVGAYLLFGRKSAPVKA